MSETIEDLTPPVGVAAPPVTVTVTAKPSKGAQTKAEKILDHGTELSDCRVIVAIVGGNQLGDTPVGSVVADIPGTEKLSITVTESA